ncbi:HERV-H LTR-associating protein 2 [Apus apus]|uniref:HERV-H LTR-associating protein 2 n=1 Tax=Apus apus TaxID=8895 RepID=UPI0021F8E9DC|nr:HERV-H LTR-associating protein 2 [Apus apus]
MKGQKITFLLIYIFHTAARLWGRLLFYSHITVTGLFSKDCILPCAFTPENDEVIHWMKGNKNVHSYYHQSDQLKDQDSDYRGRTHLSHQNIPSGDASLKLSNLTVTDEGLYTCYVGTKRTKAEVNVMLHVRVSSYYALEYQSTEKVLKCYAFLTYPVPRISWMQGNTTVQETHQEKNRVGVLYSLRSEKNITNTTYPYSCHISLPHEEWKAEWKMQDQATRVKGSSAVIPCKTSNNAANTEGSSVVWKNKNGEILAFFNGTSHSYQPKSGAQINKTDFSLMLRDLTASDSGEYLCNISTPHYTKLTVTTLQVENSSNTRTAVLGVIILVLLAVVSF